MKGILPIIFVFLQSCLFFGPELSNPLPDTSTDTRKDVGIDIVNDASSIDLSRDTTDLSIDLDDQCAPCGENMRCVDKACICKKGFVLVLGQCLVDSIVRRVTRILPLLSDTQTQTSPTDFRSKNLQQVLPFITARSSNFSAQNSHILPSVQNKTIQFSRSGKEGAVNIVANLVEFDKKHVDVFKGTLSLLDGNLTVEEVRPAIVPKKSFLVFYAAPTNGAPTNGELNPSNTSLRGEVVDGKILFSRSEKQGNLTIHWYLVVAKGDAFVVDHQKAVIPNSKKHSTSTSGEKNTLLLWSNKTTRKTFREGHVRCESLQVPTGFSDRCSRGKTDSGPESEAIEIAIQKVRFQNPAMKIKQYSAGTTQKVRHDEMMNLGPKNTVISGQLGSAGTVTLEGDGVADELNRLGHAAMCSFSIITNAQGKNVIKIHRESDEKRALSSIQYITWY